jgi:hypothetical protein
MCHGCSSFVLGTIHGGIEDKRRITAIVVELPCVPSMPIRNYVELAAALA